MIFILFEFDWINDLRHYQLTLCEVDLSTSTKTRALFSLSVTRGLMKLQVLGFDLI
jgi:hypothetical protein